MKPVLEWSARWPRVNHDKLTCTGLQENAGLFQWGPATSTRKMCFFQDSWSFMTVVFQDGCSCSRPLRFTWKLYCCVHWPGVQAKVSIRREHSGHWTKWPSWKCQCTGSHPPSGSWRCVVPIAPAYSNILAPLAFKSCRPLPKKERNEEIWNDFQLAWILQYITQFIPLHPYRQGRFRKKDLMCSFVFLESAVHGWGSC